MQPIANWLHAIGVGDCAERFLAQRITLDLVPSLTEEDLRELGLTIGQRKRVREAAERLGARDVQPPGRMPLIAERRPVSVLFCDIVGSTGLSGRLDPEELLALIQLYRDVCRGPIEEYKGYLASYQGDGVLAYFGYPSAHERGAERAVRAACGIVAAVGRQSWPRGHRLKVRLGIATGEVVVGDLIDVGLRSEQPIVGFTPNLAARLQAAAEENGILICPTTHQLVDPVFLTEGVPLALPALKEGLEAWRVIGERSTAFSRASAPFVGRQAELGRLRGSWAKAKGRRGRAFFLSGEAGIGKSRLLDEFVSGAVKEGVRALRFEGSPFHRDSALKPVVDFIGRAARLTPGDDEAAKKRKLDGILLGGEAERRRAFAAMARLLGVGIPKAPEATPELKDATFSALLEQISCMAEAAPLLIVFEDVQWLDPSTLELIGRLVRRIPTMRGLILLTARPPLGPAWPGVELIALERLDPGESRGLLRQLLHPQVQPRLLDWLVTRTDGVPLFIEEVARDTHDDPSDTSVHVPATLAEVLTARLDKAGEAKGLAQVAAVVGRIFSEELLTLVTGMEAGAFEEAVARLVSTGLVERKGPDTLGFRHALIQDVAYNSLLHKQRRHLHARIAECLIRLEPSIAKESPETLAYHFTEAGDADAALEYWIAAGHLALHRSAMAEAAHHLERAYATLREGASGPDRQERTLEVMALLGPALMAVNGPGNASVEGFFQEAMDRASELSGSEHSFTVFWNWWRVSTNTRIEARRAARLVDIAQASGNDERLLQAHHCQWGTLFGRARFHECLRQIDQGLGLYHRAECRSDPALYGNHDVRVCALGNRAQIRWMLGRSDAALIDERAAGQWAFYLNHAGSLVHALDTSLLHAYYRRDFAAVREKAIGMASLAETHDLAGYQFKARIFSGWLRALSGERGYEDMVEGQRRLEDIATTEDFPIYMAMQLEALQRMSRYEEALEQADAAIRRFRREGLHLWLPELKRWYGRLMLLHDPSAWEPASAAYRGAFRTALAQGASMLAVRAATDWADLLLRQGADERARAVLQLAIDEIQASSSIEAVRARRILRQLC